MKVTDWGKGKGNRKGGTSLAGEEKGGGRGCEKSDANVTKGEEGEGRRKEGKERVRW